MNSLNNMSARKKAQSECKEEVVNHVLLTNCSKDEEKSFEKEDKL